MMIPTYIVDDVDSDRYIARRRLAKSGHFGPVDEAADGAEFLRRYFSESPHATAGLPRLILLDINMPELDGFETIAELKRRCGHGETPKQIVAMFSSSDNERDLERSQSSGMVEHFFTKPIDDSAIAEILETYRERGFL
ncbi:Response regulator receiver domain-containing protein [Pseudooceanicola antarcticus]|uniref:Response regulator n=1 Tax=Pseudooceanicola antarcticus TaxID=1247613 RepID=A0A285JF20_9RHOB|nr:response regulator [Pseudooceanicola antarcticus]PJE31036.1 response regulator [Pseudooceanicola antarcticus]SNY58879.1 Response regulator receiver domain-containing protein [Pseudooceanicola antarcticus]